MVFLACAVQFQAPLAFKLIQHIRGPLGGFFFLRDVRRTSSVILSFQKIGLFSHFMASGVFSPLDAEELIASFKSPPLTSHFLS